MKKRILSILAFVLAMSLLLTGCELGEVQQGIRPSSGATVPPVTNPDGEVDENPFTVALTLNGKPFKPASTVTIQWSNDYEIYTADADATGVAKVGGLDGDYRVTLLNLPDGYIYDPNAYTANNFNRNIEIELQPVIKPYGQGFQLYSPISIDQTGVYYIELSGPTDKRYFEFAPTESGTYAVESWMDITANNVNPLCDFHGSSMAFREYQYTQDDGGAESTYTKNFKLTVEIAEENISKNDTGSAVFTFAVYATQKNEWPKDAQGKYEKLKLYIAITLNGEFSLEHASGTIVAPEEDLYAIAGRPAQDGLPAQEGRVDMNPDGQWRWAENSQGSVDVFDADNYRLWPVDEGGDGVYHRWDPEKYRQVDADGKVVNPGYGPVLFVRLSMPGRFLTGQGGAQIAISDVEYAGNKALTVSDGELNYKMFVEGWAKLNRMDPDPIYGKNGYFCSRYCPCRLEETCTSLQMGLANGTCETGCTKCSSECRNLEREMIGTIGYADLCNGNGDFPVTEEMKEFLQLMAIGQLYFMDGQGWIEVNSGIYATEDDQWLWACGYYE